MFARWHHRTRCHRGHCGHVNVDGVVHVGHVAASERHAHREVLTAQRVKYGIAPAQTVLAEPEPAESVALPRIGPGQVERDVVAPGGQRAGQGIGERRQVSSPVPVARSTSRSDGIRRNG